MTITVCYDRNQEDQLLPVWLIYDIQQLDWTSTLYIPIEAPFKPFTFDTIDPELTTLIVPDHVYVQHPDKSNHIGLHLPTLHSYLQKTLQGSVTAIDELIIHRLLLRISDIEDTLQYELHRRLSEQSHLSAFNK